MKPSNDREAITLIVKGLISRGVEPYMVRDGEEDFYTTDPDQIVGHITDVDEAVMFVRLPEGSDRETSHVYFVLGNDPEEVAADWGVSLEEFLDPIVSPWWE